MWGGTHRFLSYPLGVVMAKETEVKEERQVAKKFEREKNG